MAADTVTKILNYAQQLIIERGVNAFSYRDISEEVGIKTASIHYHFPTKDDLCLAVTQRFTKSFTDQLASLANSTESGINRINSYGKILINAYDDGRGFCLCASLATDEASLSEDISKVVKDFFTDSKVWVKQAIKDGQAQGEIADSVNAEKTANAIVSLFEGGLVIARAHQSDKPLKDAISWANDFLKTQ